MIDAALFLFPLELLVDEDGPLVKVDAVPHKAQYFALPHTGKEGDFEESLKGVAADGLEES